MTCEHGQTIPSRRVVALLGAVLGIALLGGCAANPKPALGQRASSPPNPPPLPRSHQSAARASESAAAAVAPQLPRTITLIWDKNDPHPDTVTEIWSAPTPAGPFTWLADAAQPPAVVPVTNAAQYFIIRNRLFNEVSDWDRKP